MPNPAIALLAEANASKLRADLMTDPGKILDARRKSSLLRQELDGAQGALDAAEARLMGDVADAKGADGKALYSNDAARKARLVLLKESDPAYLDALERYHAKRGQVDLQQAEVDHYTDLFRARRAAVELLIAEVRAWTSE